MRWHLFSLQIDPLRPALFAYCMRLTHQRASAEDLQQEALLRGFAAVSDLCEGLAQPKAFLFRVVTNLWLDQRKRRREVLLDGLQDDRRVEPPAASRIELQQALAQLSQALPAREFEAFIMRDLCEYSSREAAEALGTSPAAIKMATVLARKRLREQRARGALG